MSTSGTNLSKLFNGRGVKAPYKVRELLGLNDNPPHISSTINRIRSTKSPKYIKGVRNGNYYRIKIPPKQKILPDVPKLPNANPMPKPFKATPTEAVVAAAESASKVEDMKLRLIAWLKRNAPIISLNFGSLCTLVGFTRSDVIELRSLAMTGNLMFVVYALGQRPILWPSISWSLLFASVNAYKIMEILVERKANVHMSEEQERVYVEYFMPHGLTPKQFEMIERKAKKIQLSKHEFLIRQGEKMDHLYLVTKGSTRALVLGRYVTAASTNPRTKGDQQEGGDSGAWIGELQFLDWFWEREQGKQQQPKDNKSTTTSTTENGTTTTSEEEVLSNTKFDDKSLSMKRGDLGVSLYSIIANEDGTEVLEWSHNDMEDLMHVSSDLRAALTRAMTSALVGKVVNLTVSRTKGVGDGKRGWISWLSDWKNKGDGTAVVTKLQ